MINCVTKLKEYSDQLKTSSIVLESTDKSTHATITREWWYGKPFYSIKVKRGEDQMTTNLSSRTLAKALLRLVELCPDLFSHQDRATWLAELKKRYGGNKNGR